MSKQITSFVFTCNNYKQDHITLLEKLCYTYIVYGKEISPTTNTPHLQGYVELESRKTYNALHKALPGFHIEDRKGTQEQAIIYCKKSNDFLELGAPRSQGRRNDLRLQIEEIQSGSSITELISQGSTNLSFLTKAYTLFESQRDFPPEVHWYHGPSGSGKTKSAWENAHEKLNSLRNEEEDSRSRGNLSSVYFKSCSSGKWWDGYDGHRVVIIDDIRPFNFSFWYLLSLFDRYPCQVEFKGGTRQFRGQYIYVTCPEPPDRYHTLSKEERAGFNSISTLEDTLQLRRRVLHVYDMVGSQWPNENT